MVLLALYLIGVLIITLFTRTYDPDKQPMLNPLYKYYLIVKRLYQNGRNDGFVGIARMLRNNEYIITELVLNILLLIPLGLIVPIVSKCFRYCWKAVLLGLSISLLIEVTQLFTRLGCFELVDLLNNTLGTWIGFGLFCKYVNKPKETFVNDSQNS